ncbi:MAG: glucose-6-phosphate isomerase family protein [Phycisphaeraceae bacterium]
MNAPRATMKDADMTNVDLTTWGLDLHATTSPLGFAYGSDCFGPAPELRRLDAIRPSLREPDCDGPDPVYAIAMDVGRPVHRAELEHRHLLFGVVTYAAGRLGPEPVRSQGHVHKLSPRVGWSTPEVYEVWSGRAVILMQESDGDDPGRCFAVEVGPGEVVIVPPGWAHATISADVDQPLTFGAWCDRDYGFVYDGVRAHGGLAWFPLVDDDDALTWQPNDRYDRRELVCKVPEKYTTLGIEPGKPIYEQFDTDRDRFMFVPEPARAENVWHGFVP